MIFQKLLIVSLLIGSSLILASTLADQPSTGEQRYLLLRNGNVLKGLVRSEKDRVSVTVDGNSTLHIEPKQIAFVGPTLESLYQHQRSAVRQWGTGEHWQLAHWCIQQGLLDHAIEHYQALEGSASDSPRFKQLEYSLREALMAEETVKQAISKQSTIQPPAALASNRQAEPSPVTQASAETPRIRSVPHEANRESSETWSKHEIPGYIRKTFQNSILPVLVSRCGQSGCHGMLGKSEFHIYQPLGDQSATTLAQDLDEVLRYVDRAHMNESPLLAYATKAHGIQRNPSLNPARADERALVERISFWVKSLVLSQKPETTMPAQYPLNASDKSDVTKAVANVPVPTPATRKSKRIDEVEQDRNAKLSKPAKSAQPTEFLSMSELADLEAAIEKFETQTGSNGTSAVKKDPFDPDVFNRQFR